MKLYYNYTKLFLCIFLIGVLYVHCIPSNTYAAKIEPGFRTESLWLPSEQTKVDMAIWYPTLKKPMPVNYGDWNLLVAQNAKPLSGKYPVIILSHDSAGSRFYYHHIAASLAQRGFVVVALTHQGDNANDMEHLFTLRQIKGRIHQTNIAIDFLFKEEELSGIINTKQIAVLGIGVGGTAALLLAGATLDPTGWWDYCKNIETYNTYNYNINAIDTYCSLWARKQMNTLVKNIDPQENFTNSRVSIAIAIAPGFGMLFSKSSLKSLKKPVLIVEVENDSINNPLYHSRHITQQISTPYEITTLPKTSLATLVAPCSESLEEVLPEICSKHFDKQKQLVCQKITDKVASFFSKNLKNK